ncbi:MAG: hypothetical protein ACTSU5_03760 [Promethearchaeota archaeon]
MEDYVIFVGIFDHKLGPVCVSPKHRCKWIQENLDDPRALLQDGLNTGSKLFTIKQMSHIVQVHKFVVENPAIRGGKQRSCLFVIVPKDKPIIPENTLEETIGQFVEIVTRNDLDLRCREGDDYLRSLEEELNTRLAGAIGEGLVEHKRRDLLTTIIGYSEVLLDGILGELTEEQRESVAYILAYARELLTLK